MLSFAKAWSTQLLLAHWMACAWALQAYLQNDLMITWIGSKEYCVPATSEEAKLRGDEYDCYPPHAIWAASIYWTVTSITSIGYGDISPTMHSKRPRAHFECDQRLIQGTSPLASEPLLSLFLALS